MLLLKNLSAKQDTNKFKFVETEKLEFRGERHMTSLYKKSEICFALLWIGIYCVGMSLFDNLSKAIGLENSVSAVFALVASVFLFLWIRKSNLTEYFGLRKTTAPAKAFLFFIPLVVISLSNIWSGFSLNYGSVQLVCFIVKMLCVGFLEEIIFRGFLFRAMSKDNVKSAIIVSSVTFGIGHVINLLNGSGMNLADNIFQIIAAVFIGFLYVIIFYRGGSLIPCILSHGVLNLLSAFANSEAPETEVLIFRMVLLIVLVAGYALILLKTLPPKKATSEQ